MPYSTSDHRRLPWLDDRLVTWVMVLSVSDLSGGLVESRRPKKAGRRIGSRWRENERGEGKEGMEEISEYGRECWGFKSWCTRGATFATCAGSIGRRANLSLPESHVLFSVLHQVYFCCNRSFWLQFVTAATYLLVALVNYTKLHICWEAPDAST